MYKNGTIWESDKEMVPALLVAARDRPTGKDGHCGQHAVYPTRSAWDPGPRAAYLPLLHRRMGAPRQHHSRRRGDHRVHSLPALRRHGALGTNRELRLDKVRGSSLFGGCEASGSAPLGETPSTAYPSPRRFRCLASTVSYSMRSAASLLSSSRLRTRRSSAVS